MSALDTGRRDGRVWYASYGSNLLAERFGYYLSGGALPGQEVGHIGARDSTPARASATWAVPHALHFGGDALRWGGGGVCFIDPRPGSGTAVVRLWNVTREQFDDVAAQENGLEPGSLDVDHDAAIDAGHLDVHERRYGRVLYCGRYEGDPVFTFTGHELRANSAPGDAYMTVVARGLVECGLSPDEAAAYLMAAHGVPAGWSHAQIVALLT